MNETLQLTISDIAFGGKGVARHDGKVFFVPFVAPGDVVTVRVVKQKKKITEAELVSVDQPSPDRVEPPCPYFGSCGGCSYQHLAYERQLDIKGRQVEQTLRRVGKLAEVPMRPTIAAPEPYEYRNRIRVHVAGGVAGFFAHDAHTIIDIERCAIASPEVNTALHRLRRAAVREGDYSLRASGGGPYFEQTNAAVTRELLALLASQVRRGQSLLVDAYCGAGIFAKRLAPLFETVIGIEENANAVERAARDASPYERYVAGDVATLLSDILSVHDAARTTVILDPPAVGVVARVADILLGAQPSEILYVSCNPATLARDLALLASAYALSSVTPLDMFPQTAEIEVVAHLVRRTP
ncbi:MAG: TRAM domain-containing protein [Chthoniobacteraceae bacterium]